MTTERWKRIGVLFAGSLEVDPAGRSAWLRKACGDDEGLRAEVAHLLEQDARAARDRFLTPSKKAIKRADMTASWSHAADRQPGRAEPLVTEVVKPDWHRPLAQRRLRDLTINCLLIVMMMMIHKFVIMHDMDGTQAIPYAVVIVGLLGLGSLLASDREFSPGLLTALEAVIVGMVAAIFALTQYHAMLYFSMRDDPTRALIVVKNRVVITAVLILSYGNLAPGSWRRAALVVCPLALLPFVTFLVVHLRHPEVTERLGIAALAPLGFDLMLLLILAAGSTLGARTISRLRQQILEARQLGQYNLKRRIGAGGMGEVYLAEHLLLKRPCALKLIRPDFEADRKARKLFEREVRLTATLSHPNTIEVYDYGRTEDGTYFYVMEYLPGLTLAELVERHGPLPPGRVVYLVRQVCGALSEAHAAGLIHRDIKPSNIVASRRGGRDDVAKLLDFGLALRAVRPEASDSSAEGRILGTPLFMSPEQAIGERELDGRSDIYSLGAVAYYLLTGRPPFDESDWLRLMIAHAREPVVPPSTFRNEIPPDLERVVLRCLAKNPADRFPDSEGLERALADCECAGDWDQHRAASWWRAEDQAPAPR